METYRMTIVFNDGIRPYHNSYEVSHSDKEMLQWIENYANEYMKFQSFQFIEYLLINQKTEQVYKGKISKLVSKTNIEQKIQNFNQIGILNA